MEMCSATRRVGIMHCYPTGIFIVAIKKSAFLIANKWKKKKNSSDWADRTLFPFLHLLHRKKKKKNPQQNKTTYVLEYVYVLFPFLLCFTLDLIALVLI